MTSSELDALIGPPAPGRVRVVMRRRGEQPPRIHADYRTLLDEQLPGVFTETIDVGRPLLSLLATLALIAIAAGAALALAVLIIILVAVAASVVVV